MTRRSLLLVCTLTLSVLVSPLSGAEQQGVSRTVILGTNSVWLNKNSRVGDGATLPGGDVIANEKNLDGAVLNSGVEMSIGRDTRINNAGGASNVIEVKADSILLDRDSRIDGDAHYNEITTNQGSVIIGTQFPSLATPVLTLPVFQTAVPGALNITVNAGNSPYLLAPGAYNNITLAANATLVLTGGRYDVRSLIQDGSGGQCPFPCRSVLFDAATDLRVLERFDSGKDSRVGPSAAATIDASDVIIYVAGVNGGTGLPLSLPSAAKFGQGSDVDANIYAPRGTIRVDRYSAATGSFFGRDVLIDQGGLVVLSSFNNKAPDAVDDEVEVLEGGTVVGNVLDNDSDPNPDDALTVTVPQESGPSHGVLTLATDGSFTYTHDGSENLLDAFVYEVCDDGFPEKCATATVSITIPPVNDPPTLDPIADPAAILEDAGAQTIALSGIAQGGDAPGHNNETLPQQFPLVVSAASSNPALIPHPTVTYASPDSTGSLAYSPVADQSGTSVITVTVMDQGGTANGGDDTTQVTFTVEVTPVNDPPVVVDQSLVTDTQTLIVIDLSGSDIEGDNLTYTLVGIFSDPALGFLTDFEQGPPGLPVNEARVTFLPVGDGSTGTGSFVYEVCDDGAPPGPACAQATVTIEIVAFNPPPVAVSQSVESTVSPQLITLTGSDPGPLPDNSLDFALVSGPAFGTLSGLPQDDVGGGSVVVSYEANNPGDPDSFVFRVCDNDVPEKCALGVVAINESETQNDPPTARPDAIRVGPGGTATTLFPAGTSLLGNDSDPNGDNLAVTTTPVSGPDHGALALQADGTFSYTHADDGSTADQFVYEACDDGTPSLCATATVFIEIAPATMLVSIDISGSGSVVSSPAGIDCGTTCSATFFTATDLPIDLFPTPDAGYTFSGWDPDLSSADCLNGQLTVAADASCTAVFVVPPPPNGDPIDVSVTLVGTGVGTVTSSPEGISCPGDCSETFGFGSRVSLLPEAELDSTFEGFSGDGDCLDGELDGTGNANCVATFELLPATRWTLTVLFEGNGAGDVTSAGGEIGCSDDCSALIGDGETVLLNARPADGSSFGGYSGDCDTVSGFPFRATLVMGADASCTVTFNGPQ